MKKVVLLNKEEVYLFIFIFLNGFGWEIAVGSTWYNLERASVDHHFNCGPLDSDLLMHICVHGSVDLS